VVPGERKGNYASHNNRPRLANRGLSEEKKAVPVAIRWELSWLRSNWSKVIAALAARGRTQVAGALRPAKVLAFEDGVLRLGFDGHHETLRRRCDEAIGQAVEQSLTELAGKTIRCQYVALDADGANGADKKAPPPNRFGNFSTAEKAEIQKDPAVRTVMDLFGGSLVDIRKQPAQVDAPAADGDEKQ
ncbi:MAG: hypothetical protein SVT52_00005, partial [Planctomycetota bacterium]|nr:hypothetical protein [Planctomycetota bacterium]